MSTVEQSVALDADREQVFAFVTDPDHFPDFVAGYHSGRVTSERAAGPGSAFEWEGRLGPLSLRAREAVTSWNEPEHVAYAGELAGVGFRSRMDVQERDDGRTQLSVSVAYETPPGGRAVGRLLRPLVERRLRRSLEAVRARFGGTFAEEDALTHAQLVELYGKRAASYDVAIQLYRAFGFRLSHYRRLAADALELRQGATVVEIGCGTGANFPLLQQRVGPRGRIVGVDLTDTMLEQAGRRVRAQGWNNVELVRSDAAQYSFPKGISGILSTLALTHSPDYDAVIARGAEALAPGGRWVVLDLKEPEHWPRWLMKLGLISMKPYGVTLGAASRHPWESIERHLPHTRLRELYFGVAYLAVGWKDPSAPRVGS